MVVAHPERDRRRRVVDEDPADVREPGQQVLGELAGLRIEPEHAIAVLPSAPRFAVLVDGHVVGP